MDREYDLDLPDAVDNDFSFQVLISKGTNRRGAIAQIHLAMSKFIKEVDIGVLREQVGRVEAPSPGTCGG